MTLTGFSQLRAYWWDASGKKGASVALKLRDLRPRNTSDQSDALLARLREARDQLNQKLLENAASFMETSG